MKTILAAALVLLFSLSLAAQSPEPPSDSTATPAKAAPASTPAKTTPAATPAKATDLASLLSDAEAAVSATNADLTSVRTDKWASGWKTGWTKKSAHKQQAEETAQSLKTQAGALPGMITDVRTAHGSVGSTFKLYNSLTLVCENLDALVEATQTYGKKDEYTRLSADYANLVRIRGGLSAYVEQRAAVVDPKGNVTPAAAASAARTNKDEDAPAKKPAAKKKVVHRASK